MERKPGGDSTPPTLPAPVQGLQGAESGEKPSSSTIPMIVLPQEDPPSTASAAPWSTDPLMSNTDFLALKQFVDGRKSAVEGQGLEISDETLVQ